MFERVMDWLEAAEPFEHEQGFGDHDIQVCVAALFYHMIAIDGVVTDDERQQLHSLLQERYDLDETQLEQLTLDGEENDRQSAGLFPFTVILNRQLNAAERQTVFDQLHHLAMADGELHELEQGMLDHVKVLLKLSQTS